MNIPEKAFVCAAGFGSRMRELTKECPKPLLEVGGRSMLDRALDALADVGVKEVIVNTHYLADVVHDHLKSRTSPRVIISHEEKILDTGGGVLNQIDFFDGKPFFVLNGDIAWDDGATPALKRLAETWNDDTMDLLMLMQPTGKEARDYYMDGALSKPVFVTRAPQGANHDFTSLRIVHPRLFDGEDMRKFSFLELFHKAETAGRLYGLRHDNAWYHVSTPEDLDETNAILSAQKEKQA